MTFHFCPECGSTLFWEPERMPPLIGVAVGAFADPSFPQPEQSVGSDNPARFIDAFVDGLDLAAAGFGRVEPKVTAARHMLALDGARHLRALIKSGKLAQ